MEPHEPSIAYFRLGLEVLNAGRVGVGLDATVVTVEELTDPLPWVRASLLELLLNRVARMSPNQPVRVAVVVRPTAVATLQRYLSVHRNFKLGQRAPVEVVSSRSAAVLTGVDYVQWSRASNVFSTVLDAALIGCAEHNGYAVCTKNLVPERVERVQPASGSGTGRCNPAHRALEFCSVRSPNLGQSLKFYFNFRMLEASYGRYRFNQ